MKKFGFLIFIVALVLGVLIVYFTSFSTRDAIVKISNPFRTGVTGSGNISSETRNVSLFYAVKVSGAIEVEAISQSDLSLRIEADDNILPLIKTVAEDGVLKIFQDGDYKSKNKVKVFVSAPELKKFYLSGASVLNVSKIDGKEVSFDISGASTAKASGKAEELMIDLSGASRLDSSDLRSANVSVDGSGASSATVNVSEKISVDLSGASNVSYKGAPKDVSKKLSGVSSLKQIY